MKKSARLKLYLYCFLFAQIVSIFGDRLNQFSVVGIIGILAPGSSVELLKLAFFTHLPILVLGPVFGALVERWHKGAVLVFSDLFRGAVAFMIPALYRSTGTLYAFYLPVLLLSLANLLFSPAKSAIIPEIVEGPRLMRVNSALWSLGILATILGFLLGGWLFDYHTWALSFYADGSSYILSVFFLLPLLFLARPAGNSSGEPAPSGSPRPRLLTEIRAMTSSVREGVRLIRKARTISIGLVTQTSLFGLGGILYVIGISHVQEISPPEKTLFLSFAGMSGTFGLLLGSLITALQSDRLRRYDAISISIVIIGVAVAGFAKSDTIILVSIWSFVLGFAASPIIIFTETLLQRHIPENFRGRVFSTREVMTKTAFLALSMAGTLADAFLTKEVIMVSVGLFLALAGVLLERKKLLHF